MLSRDSWGNWGRGSILWDRIAGNGEQPASRLSHLDVCLDGRGLGPIPGLRRTRFETYILSEACSLALIPQAAQSESQGGEYGQIYTLVRPDQCSSFVSA